MKHWKRTERSGFKGCAFGYCAKDSPIHGLSAGWKMILAVAFSAAAIAVREPMALAGLLAVNLACYLLAHLGFMNLWRDIRFFLIQMAVILLLYLIKYGFAEGLWPGLRTGCQILLLFLPGTILLRTTQGTQMMGSLKKILPERLSFLLFTSLRFVPFFSHESAFKEPRMPVLYNILKKLKNEFAHSRTKSV